MNCKQGDLAVMVRSSAGNEGVIMKCLRLATRYEVEQEMFDFERGAIWVTDKSLPCNDGTYSRLQHDADLRPIRDQEGDDETLSWVGKPEKVEA